MAIGIVAMAKHELNRSDNSLKFPQKTPQSPDEKGKSEKNKEHGSENRANYESRDHGARDRADPHSAGQTDGERADRKLSRTAAGRVFARELVSKSVRCAAQNCGVAQGVQPGAAAQPPGIPHAARVRGGAGSRLLHS
jgi:hypothetical protein